MQYLGDTLSPTIETQSSDAAHFALQAEDGAAAGEPLLQHSSFVVSDATLPDMPIVYVNGAFEQLTGYSLEEIVGKSCRFLQGPDRNQPGLIELRAAIRERRGCRTVLRNYRKDGTAFWNDFSLTPILNGAGEVTHFVGTQSAICQQDLLQTLVSSSISKQDPSLDGKSSSSRLGDILVELGLVSKATIFAAEQLQKGGEDKRIGEILVERFRVPQASILKALSRQVECVRAAHIETDGLMKTAFAVRVAQKTMESVPESNLPIFSISQPLTDAGGDTFYRVLLPDGTHLLVLADVAGHSVMSSYAVASFLGMVCALSRDFRGLRKLFTDINSCLQSGPFGDVPICVFAAHWNIHTGRLHLMNAAVPHSILFRKATGVSRAVPLDGNPLGIIDDPFLSEQVIALREGDRLVFGSDGVFEALSPEEKMFQDIAAGLWSGQAGLFLGDALFAFCESVRHHTQGKLQDDVLVVAIEQPPIVLGPLEFEICIESNFIAVDEACVRLVDFVSSRTELQEQSEDWHFGLLLVTREALTNAVVHGNHEDESKSICLQCKFEPALGVLSMTVTDEGSGYEQAPGSEQMDLQTSERGRGLSIMREFSSSVSIVANELSLEFSLKGNSNG